MTPEKRIIKRTALKNSVRSYEQKSFVISNFAGHQLTATRRDMPPVPDASRRRLLENMKKAHFTMTEFGWVGPEDVRACVEICNEIGLETLIQDWTYFGGFQEKYGKNPPDPAKIKAICDYAKANPSVAGYYVWDEPFEKDTMKLARAQVDMIDKEHPGTLAFCVALPSYQRKYTWENGLYEEYLQTYADIIEPSVISFDYYPFRPDCQNPEDRLDNCRIYMDLALARSVALRKNLPLWFYFQATDFVSPLRYTEYTGGKLRSQFNLGLLYGAKGLQYYNCFPAVIAEDGEEGPLFREAQRMNAAALTLGNTLMALTSTGVYHSPEVLKTDPLYSSFRKYLPDYSESEFLGAELPARISAGEFMDTEGNRYLMLLNRDYCERKSAEIILNGGYRVYAVSAENGEQTVLTDSADRLKVTLESGDIALYRLQKPEEKPFIIEYRLEK